MDRQIVELARRSLNFGFLVDHEPLLVLDGATAESYVYADPDAAIVRARRFTETLARKLVALTQTRVDGDTQHDRIRALARAGVIVPQVRKAFDQVRATGNRAAHSHFGDVRTALSAVRTCFELGLWLHRAMSDDRSPRAFVPPPEPDPGDQPDGQELADLEALQDDLAGYRSRLAEVLERREQAMTELQAQQQARAAAEQALAKTVADRDQLQALLDTVNERAAELTEQFKQRVATTVKLGAAQRDAFIAAAQQAAQVPLTEAEVRAKVDTMLTAAGWRVQDAQDANLFAGPGVVLREVTTASGPADYLMYVDRKLVGVIEAKRGGASRCRRWKLSRPGTLAA